MKHPIVNSILVLVGAILFNTLFWSEKWGINILFFTSFIILSLFQLYEDSRQDKNTQLITGGTFLLALLVVINNSILSKFLWAMSFATMVGLVHQRGIRFLFWGFLTYINNLILVPKNITESLEQVPILRGGGAILRGIRLVIIPILIVPIFYFIYYAANSQFAALADNFWQAFFQIFNFDWDISRILFFILGIFIVGAALWKRFLIDFRAIDGSSNFQLSAEDYSLETPEQVQKVGNAYKSGLVLVISLNILLFINNILDFTYVWWNSSILKTPQELKSYVHEGTYILIFGILLAIGVVFWLFKGSLNFFKTEGILRGATYVWLAQNAILALSVGVRNWQYIDFYGLAYKRVGVFIFLVLVLAGLWILYKKVQRKRSFFYFVTKGAWAVYTVLLLSACVNWDIFITRYNLEMPVKSQYLDVDFILNDISDKNLYLLYENRDKIIAKMPKTEEYPSGRDTYPLGDVKNNVAIFDAAINTKRDNFISEQNSYSWLSWNYSDYINHQYLQ